MRVAIAIICAVILLADIVYMRGMRTFHEKKSPVVFWTWAVFLAALFGLVAAL